VDARAGGEIWIDMCGPDGTVYPMSGVFQEVIEPMRLVFTSIALNSNGEQVLQNLNTVTFAEIEEGKTLLSLEVQVLEVTDEGRKHLSGMAPGWNQSIDRLEALVIASPAPGAETSNRELRGARHFKASRELVYRMWTEPEHIAQWWGPRGFTTTIHHMDVRPGGDWRLTMHGPDGTDYPNHKVYEEIIPAKRLVMNHICWPHHRMCVDFVDAEEGTEVRVRMIFESAEDCEKVVTDYGAQKGLVENLERLEEHLTQL
jgi:uncharacterized protein YndB with AHSA1/START domain